MSDQCEEQRQTDNRQLVDRLNAEKMLVDQRGGGFKKVGGFGRRLINVDADLFFDCCGFLGGGFSNRDSLAGELRKKKGSFGGIVDVKLTPRN